MISNRIIKRIVKVIFLDEKQKAPVFKTNNYNLLDYLYKYLYKQKILQLGGDYLKQCSNGEDSRIKDILIDTSEYIKKTEKREQKLRKGLYSISKYLSQNQIEHISIKGPLFSETYYDGGKKRVCGDIDLLINKRDVFCVRDVLLSEGYAIDCTQFEKSLDYHYHFKAVKDNITFEIHWNIDYGNTEYWDYLFDNSYIINFDDITIRILDNEAQFILFVVSISKDWFTRAGVSKYYDLFQIIKHEKLDYDHVLSIIESFGLSNRYYAVLFCLRYFCDFDMCSDVHASFFTKVFSRVFLTERKVLMCNTPHVFTRRLGERIMWKDISFTSVPNIYKVE